MNVKRRGLSDTAPAHIFYNEIERTEPSHLVTPYRTRGNRCEYCHYTCLRKLAHQPFVGPCIIRDNRDIDPAALISGTGMSKVTNGNFHVGLTVST